MKRIKITPPPVEQKYIDVSIYKYGGLAMDRIHGAHIALNRAYLYAGAVGLAKYGSPADPHSYSRWHWFSKAVRHLWRYFRGKRYDSEGQHHLGASVFAITMLLAKTEG